jgi:hypothetical protein
MGEGTSVNRDHALWYEFNESGQSRARRSGLGRVSPGRARGEPDQGATAVDSILTEVRG